MCRSSFCKGEPQVALEREEIVVLGLFICITGRKVGLSVLNLWFLSMVMGLFH